MRVPEGTTGLHQAGTAIVPAGRATATMARLAREAGARLHDRSPVTSIDVEDDGSVTVVAGGAADRTVHARRLVLTADAWTNELLAHLGTSLPLTVTREQVTYFDRGDPTRVRARPPAGVDLDGRPVLLRLPDVRRGRQRCLVKAAQDCGGAETSAGGRTFEPGPASPGPAGRLHARAAARSSAHRCAR